MVEYRVQVKYRDEWKFLTDSHGKYYTYKTLEAARRYGMSHAYTQWNSETQHFELDPERHRIVVAEIDWRTVELVR
jgi:hypothetical protein